MQSYIQLPQEADFNVLDLEGFEATDEAFVAPTKAPFEYNTRAVISPSRSSIQNFRYTSWPIPTKRYENCCQLMSIEQERTIISMWFLLFEICKRKISKVVWSVPVHSLPPSLTIWRTIPRSITKPSSICCSASWASIWMWK